MKMCYKKPSLFLGRAFCFLVLIFSGCTSSKKVETVEVGGIKSQKAFFELMQEQELPFRTLSARMNVNLKTTEKELASRVDLKMVKDSAFQLSVQPFLGIEIFRMELTPDSIKVLDRMNKQYVAENYEDLRGQTPIEFNFYNLQALFVNRLFLPGHEAISPKEYHRFKLKQEGSLAEIKVKDSMKLLYRFIADGEGKLLSTDISDASNRYALQWAYTDFRLVNDHPFPMLMRIDVFKDGRTEGGGDIHFSRIQTNGPLNMDFSIPSKYKRITFAKVMKSIHVSKK